LSSPAEKGGFNLASYYQKQALLTPRPAFVKQLVSIDRKEGGNARPVPAEKKQKNIVDSSDRIGNHTFSSLG
jgi:hypothetical protein